MTTNFFLDRKYAISGRQIDPITGNLYYRGEKGHLRRKQLEVLALLASAEGYCVRRGEFIDRLWQGNLMVGEVGLTDTIAALRRSLQDNDSENPLIRTIPRQGYQLNTEVLLSKEAEESTLIEGNEVNGRPGWFLQRRFAQTDFSETWLAAESSAKRLRIFKFCRSEAQLQQLRREATVMRYLRESLEGRSDIVAILDWRLHEPPYFLEYEPFGHGDLVSWSQTQGGLVQVPVETRLSLFEDIVAALAAVHSVAIAHRNLSATAVGIEQRDGRWRARVGDFGFGLITEPERLKHWQLSSSGMSVDAQGAPPSLYRPPGAGEEAGPDTDIYALGVLGVQLVIGQWSLPVLAEALALVAPHGLRVLLQRCLNVHASHRPDVATLYAELQALLRTRSGELVTAVAMPVGSTSPAETSTLSNYAPAPTSENDALPNSEPTEPARKPALRNLGPFRILDELGHGGMGSVYLAEQVEPVRRKVALKLIKAGVDPEQVLARFEAERQTLAMMSHPNIAAILESGSTPAGLPYFAMEYVPGVDICSHCDQQKLNMRQRVGLFLKVCDGVLHAHQKGIVHRDLKPGNILIRQLAEQPALAKIIDFGVAKSLQGHLVGCGTHTRFGHFVGTPAYCSPEQIASPSQQVDTRSDIYSLGVVLYELLIGVTPRDEKDLGDRTPHELAKLLRDSPTPTLISRFSNLSNEQQQKVAMQHAMSPEAMRSLLASDLDWVVSKCIAADPEDRYATVQELKKDLLRWLEDRPVEARPQSQLYRLRKLIWRNRMVAALVALSCLLLIGTTVAAVLGYVRAESSALQARQAAAFQADQMKSMSPEAMGQSFRTDLIRSVESLLSKKEPAAAVAKRALLMELIDGVDFTGLTTSQLDKHLFQPGLRVIDEKYLAHPELQATLRESSADTLVALGLHDRALEPQEQAIAFHKIHSGENDARTLNAQAKKAFILSDLDRTKEAIKQLDETISAMRASRNMNTTEAVKALTTRAHLYNMQGQYPSTRKYLNEALEIATQNFGPNDARTLRTEYDLEISFVRESSLEVISRLVQRLKSAVGPDHPDTLAASELLASRQADAGFHEEALATSQSVLSSRLRVFGENHRDVAKAQSHLSRKFAAVERYDDAIDMMRTSTRNNERILGSNSPSAFFGSGNLGTLLLISGDVSEARENIKNTVEMAKSRYGEGTPSHLIYSGHLAEAEYLRGDFDSALTNSDFVAETITKIRGNAGMIAESRERSGRILLAKENAQAAKSAVQKALDALSENDPRDRAIRLRVIALSQYIDHLLENQTVNALLTTWSEQKSDQRINWLDTVTTATYVATVHNNFDNPDLALAVSVDALKRIDGIFPRGHYAMLPLVEQEVRALQALNRLDEATAAYDKGLRVLDNTSELDPRWRVALEEAVGTIAPAARTKRHGGEGAAR